MRPYALLTASLTTLGLTTLLLTAAPQPVPMGPGAVVAMHGELFRALDAGDAAGAMKFLHDDVDMQEPYEARPCSLFFDEVDGLTAASMGHEASRPLLVRWAQQIAADQGATWSTRILNARDHCFDPRLSYCVMEFERRRVPAEGEPESRRYLATSLVIYGDDGWQLTHWQIAQTLDIESTVPKLWNEADSKSPAPMWRDAAHPVAAGSKKKSR